LTRSLVQSNIGVADENGLGDHPEATYSKIKDQVIAKQAAK
jgi:hypothetical protein